MDEITQYAQDLGVTIETVGGFMVVSPEKFLTKHKPFFEDFQLLLKMIAAHNQGNKDVDGNPFKNSDILHLHHALISKRDVMGMAHANRMAIHHTYNVIAVRAGNEHDEFTREKAAKFLADLYGYETVKTWYDSFGFKSRFRPFPYEDPNG